MFERQGEGIYCGCELKVGVGGLRQGVEFRF